MDESAFILAAYAIAGALLLGLCIATWLRARRVARQLSVRDGHET